MKKNYINPKLELISYADVVVMSIGNYEIDSKTITEDVSNWFNK